MTDVLRHAVRGADGSDVALDAYRGQVLLIVNTASQCGFTGQYAGLEALYRRFGPQGFQIIAFPCNQFGGQEPGDAAEIRDFCQTRYDVTFPVMAKLDVNGPNQSPLFAALKQARSGLFGSAIKWNFTKFLVNRRGQVTGRYAPSTKPARLASAIERALAEPA